MRPGISILLLSACSSAVVSELPPASVRDRLDTPTRLLVASGSTGAIDARRWSSEGWSSARVALGVETGELVMTTDAEGQLAVTGFGVGFAPIELPVADHALVSQLHLDLTSPPAIAPATWNGDDAARAEATFDLELSWSLTVDGEAAPLGDQRLPPMTVRLGFAGDGTAVDATIAIVGPGTVWSWGGLIALADLTLALDAATP